MCRQSIRVAVLLGLVAIASHLHAQGGRYTAPERLGSAEEGVDVTGELQSLIDRCSAAGGGTVFLPPGDYRIGTLLLKDNTVLELSAGATLYGSADLDAYDEIGDSGITALIGSAGAKNIGIVGRGVINGQGDAFWRGKKRPYKRPGRLLLLFQCEDIKIRDVSITNSPNWCVDVRECDRVWIDGVTILNERKSPNTDGIDPVSSSNVFISNCLIDTGDDAICPKTRGPRPLENLVVTNCVLRSDDSAIKLGTRSDSDIRNVTFSNIVIRDTQYGIALFAKDGGAYEDIRFQGIQIETTRASEPERLNQRETYPIFVDVERRSADSRLGSVRGVVFSDISVDTLEGSCLFLGQPDSLLRDLRLTNIDFTLHHRNPTADNRKPRGTRSLRDRAANDFSTEAASLVFAHVEGLDISGLRYTDRNEGPDNERRVIWARDVHRVSIRDLFTRHATPNRTLPLMRFEGAADVEVSSCSPGPTMAAFVEVGASTERVVLHGNNAERAARLFQADKGFDEDQIRKRHNLADEGSDYTGSR